MELKYSSILRDPAPPIAFINLCVDCLERRIGRALAAADFPDMPCNHVSLHAHNTPQAGTPEAWRRRLVSVGPSSVGTTTATAVGSPALCGTGRAAITATSNCTPV